VHGGGFCRKRLPGDSSHPVVTGSAIRGIGDGAVVDYDVGDVHIVDGAVIVEATPAPIPALVADPAIAESIVDAAVVADVSAPEAVVVAISPAVRSPISRSPQVTHLRREYPGSRHPVVALGGVTPVSGRPKIAVAGAFRL
jgi:hypothetical protein